MTWLMLALTIAKWIYWAYQHGPEIAHWVEEIWSLIRRNKDPQAREALGVELDRALDLYKRSRDRGALYELRQRLRKQCYGPHCEVA